MFIALFIASLILLLIISFVCLMWSSDTHNGFFFFIGAAIGTCSLVAALVALVLAVTLSFDWFAAEHKAKIINSEYGTNYSREEVFFASSVIDTIRELDRKRVEINGDLIHGK